MPRFEASPHSSLQLPFLLSWEAVCDGTDRWVHATHTGDLDLIFASRFWSHLAPAVTGIAGGIRACSHSLSLISQTDKRMKNF